ncbi:MAG: tetratricopeptide repeat protein [Candidatus Abyssobacteria bacterium SURF_17]|uniref:Tetratricopeptide repeat protein n=1 Tax=Candidatus Abyssobacteria bacterium SURF_17 TaxID=2093361 RepID=A0A419F8G2_9BACT|nr:MAG: tetratricopeptide repeat protein [Candidatus Abyssubacteria bacterium SURF_17]
MAYLIRNPAVWIPLTAALLAAIVFCNTLPNDFVWDDNELIVNNPSVHGLSEAGSFLSRHFWSQSGQPSTRGYYRPFILFSYAVDYTLWGPNPLGFHLTNLLWHALASALVGLFILRVTNSSTAALVAGAFFAVHPVHVESVAFVSGRTDVIATALMLVSILLFFRRNDGRAGNLKVALSLAFFALALLAKEIAVVLPALVLVGDLARKSAGGKRAAWPVHTIYWLVLALYLTARFGLLNIAPSLQEKLSPREILFTMPLVFWDYLRLLVLPIHLCADYVVHVQQGPTIANLAAIGALIIAGGAIAFSLIFSVGAQHAAPARRIAARSVTAFFATWIFLGLLPVLQIIPISALKAERFLYLSSVGFCALVGMVVSSEVNRMNVCGKPAQAARHFLNAALIIVMVVLSVLTIRRNTVWKNEFVLYHTTVLCAPDNFRVQYNLGNAYFRKGDVQNAIRHTEIALQLRPDLPQASYNLGVMHAAQGSFDKAEAMYRRAIQLDPSYALAHNNLAVLLYSRGNLQEAKAEWQKALSLDPTLEQAREGLSILGVRP